MKIAKEIGDWAGEGKAYGNLGNAYLSLGDYQKAIDYHEKRLKIAKEIGDRIGEGRGYVNLGSAYWSLGFYRKAIEYHAKHLKIPVESLGENIDLTEDKSVINMNEIQHLTYLSAFDQ